MSQPLCSVCLRKPAQYVAADCPVVYCCSPGCARVWRGPSAPVRAPLRCAAHALASAPGVKRSNEDEDVGPEAKRARPQQQQEAEKSTCEQCNKLLVVDTLGSGDITEEQLADLRHESYFSPEDGTVIHYYVPVLGDASSDMTGLLAWLRDATITTYLQETAPMVCPKLISAGIMPLLDRKILTSHGQPALFDPGTLVGWVQYELHAGGGDEQPTAAAAAAPPVYKRQSSLRDILTKELSRLNKLGTDSVTVVDLSALGALITNVLECVYALHFAGIVHGNLTCDALFAQRVTVFPANGGLDPVSDVITQNADVFRGSDLQTNVDVPKFQFRCVDFSRARPAEEEFVVFSNVILGLGKGRSGVFSKQSTMYQPGDFFERIQVEQARAETNGYRWIKSLIKVHHQLLLYHDLRKQQTALFEVLLARAMVDKELQARRETTNRAARPMDDLVTLATSMLRLAAESEEAARFTATAAGIRKQITRSFFTFIERVSVALAQKNRTENAERGTTQDARDIYDFYDPDRRRDLPDLFELNKHAESLPRLYPVQTSLLLLRKYDMPADDPILRLPESWTALNNPDGTCWLNVVIICLACIRAYSYSPVLSPAPAGMESHFRHALRLFEVINQLWDWMLPEPDPWATPLRVSHRGKQSGRVFGARAPTHPQLLTESRKLTPGSLCNMTAIPRAKGSTPQSGLEYLLEIFANGNPPTEYALGPSSPWLDVFIRAEHLIPIGSLGAATEQPIRGVYRPIQMTYYMDSPEAIAADQTTTPENSFQQGIERARIHDANELQIKVRYGRPFADVLVFARMTFRLSATAPMSSVQIITIPQTYTFPADYLMPGVVSPTYELFAVVYSPSKSHVAVDVRTAEMKFQRVDNGDVTDVDYTDGIHMHGNDIEQVWYAQKPSSEPLPAPAPGFFSRLFGAAAAGIKNRPA